MDHLSPSDTRPCRVSVGEKPTAPERYGWWKDPAAALVAVLGETPARPRFRGLALSEHQTSHSVIQLHTLLKTKTQRLKHQPAHYHTEYISFRPRPEPLGAGKKLKKSGEDEVCSTYYTHANIR